MNIYKQLNEVIDYLENNLNEKIDYNKTAKILGTNLYIAEQLFKLLTGITMKEYVKYDEPNHGKIDIADPWGYDKETYLECSKEISKCIELLLKEIKENA